MKVLIIPILAVLFDQATKWIVRETMELGESVRIIGNIVRFTHVENTGMAFGIQVGNYGLFTLISIVVAGIIALYLYRVRHSRWYVRWSFALIFGGAIGNLIDRIWRSGVTDFVDADIPDIVIASNKIFGLTTPLFSLYRWPVFNVADACVTVGMVVLFWVLLFKKEKIL